MTRLTESESTKWNKQRMMGVRCLIARLYPRIEYRFADIDPESVGRTPTSYKFSAKSAREIYRYIHYTLRGEHVGGHTYSRRENPNKSECLQRTTALLATAGYEVDDIYGREMWSDKQVKAILQFLRDHPPEDGIPECRFCDEQVLPRVNELGAFPRCPNCGVSWERIAPDPFQTVPTEDQQQ